MQKIVTPISVSKQLARKLAQRAVTRSNPRTWLRAMRLLRKEYAL